LREINIRIAAAFLVFILLFGPTVFILGSFLENTGNYLQNLISMRFFNESFEENGNWQNDWTVFYWAWWISWSPFVGIFIARVSRGRTIREFVLGVLIVPSILTFFWLTTFGGTAIHLVLDGVTEIATEVQRDEASALFVFLESFPLTFISSLIAVLLITSFFITSSDSGSLVIDALTSGGKLDTPVTQRAFWAICVGAVAAVLLLGGGLRALQTAAITTGLPFAVVLLFMSYSLYKGLVQEHAKQKELEVMDKGDYDEILEEVIERRLREKRKDDSDNKDQQS
jgi:choline/glycine/proline betaine transport protein